MEEKAAKSRLWKIAGESQKDLFVNHTALILTALKEKNLVYIDSLLSEWVLVLKQNSTDIPNRVERESLLKLLSDDFTATSETKTSLMSFSKSGYKKLYWIEVEMELKEKANKNHRKFWLMLDVHPPTVLR